MVRFLFKTVFGFLVLTFATNECRATYLTWYHYNSSGGATVLTDSSGNGYNATATGATFVANRPANANLIAGVPLTAGSLLIDGNFGSGARTNAIDLTTLSMIQASGGITFETWLYRSAMNNNTTGIQVIMETEADGLFIERETNFVGWTNGESSRIVTNTAVGIGEWHHIAGVFDTGSNAIVGGFLQGNIRFYLDGALILNAPTEIGPQLDNIHRPLGIGRHAELGFETFNGMLFESRVSLGALTTDQMLLPKQVVSSPEPTSLALFGLGGLGMFVARSCRRWL